MKKSNIENSPEIVKAAGQYLYEKYYGSVVTVCSRFRRKHGVEVGDLVDTWFLKMLELIKSCWDPVKESMENFIARRWYYVIIKAWRCAHHIRDNGKGNPISVPCISYDELCERNGDAVSKASPKIYHTFEEYEEFENIVSQIRPSCAKVLRIRVYEELSAKDIAKRCGLTRRSVDTMLQEARDRYRKIYKERHNEKDQCVYV